MRRYLVVAHRTLSSPELLDAIRERMAQGPSTFHLLVPEEHGTGMIWDEGQVRLDAEHHLEEARVRLLNEGVPVTGEVGKVSPVTATTDLLRREGHGAFAEIIVSTLPVGASKWLGMDAPKRIRRITTIPVTHIEAASVHVS